MQMDVVAQVTVVSHVLADVRQAVLETAVEVAVDQEADFSLSKHAKKAACRSEVSSLFYIMLRES